MLVRAPTRSSKTSPRSTQPNQTLEPAPISTSPIRCAPVAMNAPGATRGAFPRQASRPDSGIRAQVLEQKRAQPAGFPLGQPVVRTLEDLEAVGRAHVVGGPERRLAPQ